MKIGQICVKTAGRDAGKKCVILDILEGNFVLIDGETRRRKCNILHLEPLPENVGIEKNASREEVATALKKLNINIRKTTPKQTAKKPAPNAKIAATKKVVVKKAVKNASNKKEADKKEATSSGAQTSQSS